MVTKSFRVVEEEILDFLDNSPSITKTVIEALKLLMANQDVSFVHMHIAQLKAEIDQYERMLAWKKSKDNVHLDKLAEVQASEKLERWVKWYDERIASDVTIANDWLENVISTIRLNLEFDISIEEFKEYYKKRQGVK